MAMMLSFLLVASCSTPDTSGLSDGTGEVRFDIGINDQTRAETDARFNTSFEEGDAIGIFAVKRNKIGVQAYPSADAAKNYAHNAKWVRDASGKWSAATSFDKIFFPADEVLDFYAYYPYSENADPTAIGYDAANRASDLMTARTLGMFDTAENVPLTFVHKLVLIQVDITAPGFKHSATSGKMINVVTDAVVNLAAEKQSDEITTLERVSDINMEKHASSLSLRAYIPAQTILQREVLFKISNGERTLDIISSYMDLKGGTVRNFIVTDEDSVPVSDQSLLPNSYIVPPGEGVVIPVAKAYAMWEKNADLVSFGESLTGEPTAELMWEEYDGLISDMIIVGSGRNAFLKVITNGKFGSANAVVGVKINGQIRWSWHIWVTDYDPNLPANQKTNNGFVLMDRNLGAWNNTVDDVNSVGMGYQWGRKEPFTMLLDWEGYGKPIYYPGSRDNTYAAVLVDNNPALNMYNSVVSPRTFLASDPYYNSNNKIIDWYNIAEDDWKDRWVDANGNKTPYDPCPEGWRVPAGSGDNHFMYGLMELYGDIDGEYTEHGFNFNTVGFFPKTGMRHANDGQLWFWYMYGYIWTAEPIDYLWSTGQGSATGMEQGFCIPETGLPRAAAIPVRCVLE